MQTTTATKPLFSKILIANRSEIAIRVMNACRSLGIKTVAVYSDADEKSKHRWYADEAVHIGPAPASESYLVIEKIIAAGKQTGAEAIHPGYGFLSENPSFPKACKVAGLVFIGPSAEAMLLMGNKVESRKAVLKAGVPMTPGMRSSSIDLAEFDSLARSVGYPVMLKAAAGGGGKGMRIVHNQEQLASALEAAQREARSAFGDDAVYLEKFIANPRHIEFQVIADTHGNCVHLFERECSIQRRHQKIIEETPSVALTPELRSKMGADAVLAARAANYTNAGTVEFLLDQSGAYYFLEMNTRIQVEHPITEMVTGVDLVVEQIRIAAGLPLSDEIMHATQRGHAIECRIYAEDGENNFLPATGTILRYSEPVGPGIRVDSGIQAGMTIGIDYDPIMAKLIVHAPDRPTAITKMIQALHQFQTIGIRGSKRFMVDILSHPAFAAGETYTSFIEQHCSNRPEVDEPIRQVAAAFAAIASENASAIRSDTSEATESISIWQQIGAWQIGSGKGS